MEVSFINPGYLWFILAVPIIVSVHFISMRFTRSRAVRFANFEAIEEVTGEKLITKNYTLLIIRVLIVSLFVLGMAGMVVWYESRASLHDFIIAIDNSGSMLANDFSPDRLEAAKESAIGFVDSVSNAAEIGVVSFTGVAVINQRLTGDTGLVKEAISSIQVEAKRGTAIGNALVTCTNLLQSSSKAKTIILLTDGQSNYGIPVYEGVRYARDNDIVIHTIGIGTEGGGAFEAGDVISKLDVNTLVNASEETGGLFFRAEDKQKLESAYSKISSITEQKVSENLSPYFFVGSLVLLIIEYLLVNTRYRTLP